MLVLSRSCSSLTVNTEINAKQNVTALFIVTISTLFAHAFLLMAECRTACRTRQQVDSALQSRFSLFSVGIATLKRVLPGLFVEKKTTAKKKN